jgi:hypothetical protein
MSFSLTNFKKLVAEGRTHMPEDLLPSQYGDATASTNGHPQQVHIELRQ